MSKVDWLGTFEVDHFPSHKYRFGARRHPDWSLDCYVCDVLDSEDESFLARWERVGEWDGDLMKELPRWKPLGLSERIAANHVMEGMLKIALERSLTAQILGEGK